MKKLRRIQGERVTLLVSRINPSSCLTMFFQKHTLPVFQYLSPATKRALEAFLASGNRSFREKRVLEFFKSIDWMALEEIPKTTLEKLPVEEKNTLYSEINGYLQSKAETRQQNSEKRKNHKLRVFEYFRNHMPAADKALLESLRDYELERTGRDTNWQHYFSMKSFKQIDGFIASSHAERHRKIELFKADVETYRKNKEKLYHQTHCNLEDADFFQFDDWCEWADLGDFEPSRSRQKSRNSDRPIPDSPLKEAYQALRLAPGAPLKEVKRNFRQLTLQHHPDLPGGNEELMKNLILAYETIKKAHSSA